MGLGLSWIDVCYSITPTSLNGSGLHRGSVLSRIINRLPSIKTLRSVEYFLLTTRAKELAKSLPNKIEKSPCFGKS